ncbi:TIGR04282 family arsenosugar biosynthesis glycosyltransferase [Actinoplanes sp. LDG1-06]|uniref:TIGR04282 family arsenosugar biosynthesis glycosyltransferase n=1 Tax=Paractinoplanes ovalisporus TaxID=2810368 RepID=A0ABS2A754_9ACTN|nr:TIGR04282 family arsenosugar biosynthesis glycosyltransferase [Actinoplanes ovalisporus]MBM2615081.1 TIGR04282 family arsenosugar biosynthesis glycosyltransferase [Actinoplanes ovalisporus]
MSAQILVMAKTPVPGRVKTRLCPPCTPARAARIAAAALADTVDAVTATRADARILVVDGDQPAPAGWGRAAQRGDDLGERLAHAYTDTAGPGRAALLIGMDTPQADPWLLAGALATLLTDGVDAVLGPASDGGWWALGLRDPAHAQVLRDIPTSTATTGALTLAALTGRGLRVAALPTLTDVDTMDDAYAVAALCRPQSRFAMEVAA